MNNVGSWGVGIKLEDCMFGEYIEGRFSLGTEFKAPTLPAGVGKFQHSSFLIQPILWFYKLDFTVTQVLMDLSCLLA